MWIFTPEGAPIQGTGVVAVVGNPTLGNVTYAPAAADSAKGGTFFVALKAVYGDGSILWQQPAVKWIITTLP